MESGHERGPRIGREREDPREEGRIGWTHGRQVLAIVVSVATVGIALQMLRDSDKKEILDGLNNVRIEVAAIGATVNGFKSMPQITLDLANHVATIKARQEMNEERIRTLEEHEHNIQGPRR